MNLTPKRKFVWLCFVVVLIGLAIGCSAVIIDAEEIKWMFFLWVAVGSFILMRIRCPQCGVPVAYQGRLGGMPLYAVFFRKNCQNCGNDLTK